MELAFDRTSNCQEVGYVARRRIVDSPNTKSVAFHKEKPLQTGQNGRHSTRMGPNTKSNKKFGQQPSPLNTRTIDDSSQNVSHSCMKPQQGTASEERSHELHKSSQVKVILLFGISQLLLFLLLYHNTVIPTKQD